MLYMDKFIQSTMSTLQILKEDHERDTHSEVE